MRSPLLLIFFLITCILCPASEANEVVISLYNQIVGPAWITQELRLETNGDVVEEKYNWNLENYHSVNTIRHVEKSEIDSFLVKANKYFEALPRVIDKGRPIPPDGEFKDISVGSGDKGFKARWYSYNDALLTDENQRFQKAWEVLKALLLGKKPNK